jgi:hypothetical protein
MSRSVQILIVVLLLTTIALQSVVIVSANTAAPIIQQVEGVVGRSLTCTEAYGHREIRACFDGDRQTTGDVLYMSNLFSIPWMIVVGFAALFLAVSRARGQRDSRPLWVLAGLVVALLIPLIIYAPLIHKIARAVE